MRKSLGLDHHIEQAQANAKSKTLLRPEMLAQFPGRQPLGPILSSIMDTKLLGDFSSTDFPGGCVPCPAPSHVGKRWLWG